MTQSLDDKKPLFSETLGGELKKGWDDTSRLANRLESFGVLKHRTSAFIEWAHTEGVYYENKLQYRIFKRLTDCGQYLIFRNYQDSQVSRLIGACSCKQHLLCAFCASRRGVRMSMAYKERVEAFKSQSEAHDLLFLTFTVQNGPNLSKRFYHLKNSMQKLTQRRNFERAGRGTHKSEFTKLSGGVFAYEFKRGANSNEWHPHIHMLALIPSGQRVDAQRLKDEWFEITGDSKVINVQLCTNDQAYLEVFAYALKFSEMSHADRWFAFNELKGERLISSFGCLRSVDVPDLVEDDILSTDEPFVDVLYRWLPTRGYSGAITLARPETSAA